MKDNIKQSSNKKYLVYVRVSSKDQAKGASLEVQAGQIEAYAKNKELVLQKPYFSEEETAAKVGRAKFQEMIDKMQKGKYAGVIFHKTDRSGRNPSDQARLYELMQQGYEFHFAAENISTNEHIGRNMLYLLWGIASGYSENLKMEVKKGISGMLKRGYSPNPAPTGYVDKGHGVKEPHPIQGPLIRTAFELYATGLYSIVMLQKKMEEMGLRNKKGTKINHKSLYKILRKKFYYGVITYWGEDYAGAHKPIISKDLFEQVQRVLDGKGFKHQRKNTYYFQALVFCPNCKKRLRCVSAKQRYKYYNCTNPNCKYNLDERIVEDQFVQDLSEIEFADDEVEMFMKAITQFRQDLKELKSERVKDLKFEISKIESRIEELIDQFSSGTITSQDYSEMKSGLINKKMEYVSKLNGIEASRDTAIVKLENLGNMLKKPLLAYKKASGEARRQIVYSLVENFTLNDKKVITNWKSELVPIQNRDKWISGSATGNRTPIWRMKTACPNR